MMIVAPGVAEMGVNEASTGTGLPIGLVMTPRTARKPAPAPVVPCTHVRSISEATSANRCESSALSGTRKLRHVVPCRSAKPAAVVVQMRPDGSDVMSSVCVCGRMLLNVVHVLLMGLNAATPPPYVEAHMLPAVSGERPVIMLNGRPLAVV